MVCDFDNISSMNCLYCKHDTEVTNSRVKSRTPAVWRRRKCKACQAEFSSLEQPIFDLSVSVRGKNGKLYPFSRDKLFLSLHTALGHRSDSVQSSTELTATVIGKVIQKYLCDGVVDVKDLSGVAHQALKRFDNLSAGTYKAYHQGSLKR